MVQLATFLWGVGKKEEYDIERFFCEKVQKHNLSILYKKILKKNMGKIYFLSAYSGMTTITEKTIGEIFNDKNLKKNF